MKYNVAGVRYHSDLLFRLKGLTSPEDASINHLEPADAVSGHSVHPELVSPPGGSESVFPYPVKCCVMPGKLKRAGVALLRLFF